MGKLLLVLSLISLIFLQLGCYIFPSNPVMWLATNSPGYDIVRLTLMPMLGLLLVTNPPRHNPLRYALGTIALSLLVGVACLTYNNHMVVLDTMAFGAAGLAVSAVALEINYTVSDVVDLEALRQAKQSSPLIQH